MRAILPEQPEPHQMPAPDAGVVMQFARPDRIIKVCAACGAVVGWGFEERHAATHAEVSADA